MYNIVYYTNQFFANIGGEDMAYQKPFWKEELCGAAIGLQPRLKDARLEGIVVCGDNYYAENGDQVKAFVRQQLEGRQVDLFIAGPAFNAGRFGMACGDICQYVQKELGIKAFSAMYWENPAVEIYKRELYILEVEKSAAGMRKAVPLMADFANKLLSGQPIGLPNEEGYFASGKRVNLFRERNGAERAVDMLLKKLSGAPFETEVPISIYEKVKPAAPVPDLSKAKIALVTSGGIVPVGNPDRLPASTSKFYKKYDISKIDRLEPGKFFSVHAGYDPVYANEDPNRVAPVDALKELERRGEIGSLYPYYFVTTGNSTSVTSATSMGRDIAQELLEANVNAVILTST